MSDSPTLRFTSTLALALILSSGCGADSDAGSTLPGAGVGANPDGSGTELFDDRANALSTSMEGLTRNRVAAFVEGRARQLAGEPYRAPPNELPRALAELDYDAYRSIRFRPDAALWQDSSRFEVQLFHPGFLFDEPVRVHVVDESARTLDFDPSLFSYEGAAAELTDDLSTERSLGYAGFRVHFPLNAPGRMDEVVVFQGASYFRLVGPGQVYGLSSRGLAVDVATDRPEEFPDFREFWLIRPEADADTLVIHALLDSPSVTGAYRFVLEPGESTEMRVEARLFARVDVGKLGVAPLSSMFLFGSGTPRAFDDFRAGVHDSDGLMARTRKDEWIWRPLSNGRGLRVTSLRDVDPRGFGLAQRARDFDSFLDLEARYHDRPSEWVRVHPDDRWDGGGVELLEIPTETEFNDNIAAYWVPEEPFRAGDERRYRYTLSTFGRRLPAETLGHVVRTRVGRATLPGEAERADVRRFVVDFRGGALDELPADESIEVSVETFAGTIDDVRAEALPDGGWRASFRVEADSDRPPDMRLFLEADGSRVTETWTYAWYPGETR
jgi:glucans biosynthesis protein